MLKERYINLIKVNMRYVISHVVVVFSLILLDIIIASNDSDYKMNTNVMYMKSTVDIGINESYWSNNLYSKDFSGKFIAVTFTYNVSTACYSNAGLYSFTNTANICKSHDMTHAKLSGQAGCVYQTRCIF